VLPGSSLPVGGPFNWDSSWLPKKFGGVEFRSGPSPIFDLGTLDKGTIRQQQLNLSLLEDLNRIHLAKLEGASEFESRIESFELAARMQFAAPDCVDISKESLGTQRLYGIGEPETDAMGKRCLLARRLVERGVRFVQIMSENQVWDNHTGLQKNLTECCKAVDHPAAGLIKDLKARDLLQDTLVIFAGEFGRLPTAQDLDGRDHNPHAFTIWMAGGGVKQGYVHGTTDEFGYKAIEKRVSVADLHATVLKILGLDNSRLSYRAHGRDQTLTDINDATVVDEIIA
jgi:hypothetical protein